MKSPFAAFAGLDRAIYALFAAQVVNSLGHFVHPFLTLFFTQRLGLGEAQAGGFLFLISASWAPGLALGGRIADRFGRKASLLLFHLLSALCLVPCAFLDASPAVPWLLLAANFFRGAAEPINDALVTDVTRAEQRKAAFSLLYLGHNLGLAGGLTIAGYLFNRAPAWLFLGDALTTAAALLLILLWVRETAPSRGEIERSLREDTGPERAERGSLFAVLLRRPFLLAFLAIQIVFSFVYSQSAFSLPLQLKALFGEGGAQRYGLLMSVNTGVVILMTTVALRVTARMKPALAVALAGAFFAVGFGMVGFLRTLPLFFASTVIWTLGEILSVTNSSVYIANHSPLSHRGRFNAIAPLIMGSGFSTGPWLTGLFIERFSVFWVWPLSFALCLFGSAALLLLHAREGRATARAD